MKRLLIFVGIIGLAVVGCAKHDDAPPGPLSVAVPSTPQNFTIATTDFIVWDLSWTVDDPSSVRIFYVYTYSALTGFPQLSDSTTNTSEQYNIGVAVPGLLWGVSAVSHDNVESPIRSGTATP
jgi:hypothetical protein